VKRPDLPVRRLWYWACKLNCELHVPAPEFARSHSTDECGANKENSTIPKMKERSYATLRNTSWRTLREHYFVNHQSGLPTMRRKHDRVPMQWQMPQKLAA
jgi:hypothetical protein